MPSRAYTSFLHDGQAYFFEIGELVSMPSRAYTSFLHGSDIKIVQYAKSGVNALSGLYIISTWTSTRGPRDWRESVCQCPLRLIHHFYLTSSGIVSPEVVICVNALSGLYIISTVPLQKPRFYAVSRACFCRYLSEYSDNSRFSCMLTFWTYLMRCTYP